MGNEPKRMNGFTLIELMLALVIASLLLSVAVPGYTQYIDRTNERKAIGDMGRISLELKRFQLRNNNQLPDSLDDINFTETDPWGNPYAYLRIEGADVNRGDLRKDRNLNPLNSDFDLYSAGPDGQSRKPLTSKHSRDDIIRAHNGAFMGGAEDH